MADAQDRMSYTEELVREWFHQTDSLTDWDDVEALDMLVRRIDEAVVAERERCARIVENRDAHFFFQRSPEMIRQIIAEAIRRG